MFFLFLHSAASDLHFSLFRFTPVFLYSLYCLQPAAPRLPFSSLFAITPFSSLSFLSSLSDIRSLQKRLLASRRTSVEPLIPTPLIFNMWCLRPLLQVGTCLCSPARRRWFVFALCNFAAPPSVEENGHSAT